MMLQSVTFTTYPAVHSTSLGVATSWDLQPQVFSLQSARLRLKLQHTLCNDNLIFAAECGGTFAVSNCFSPLKLKICFKFCSRKGTNGAITSKTNICSGKSWIAAATAKSTTYHDPCHLFFNRHGSESNRPKMNGWHRRRRLSLARRWITTTVHVSKPCFKATCLSEQVKGKSSPEVTLTYSNKPKKTRSREREKSAILKTGEYKQQKSLLQMRILLQWNLTQAVECPPGEAEKMQTQEHRQFTPVCLAVQPNRGQRVWEFGDRRKRC